MDNYASFNQSSIGGQQTFNPYALKGVLTSKFSIVNNGQDIDLTNINGLQVSPIYITKNTVSTAPQNKNSILILGDYIDDAFIALNPQYAQYKGNYTSYWETIENIIDYILPPDWINISKIEMPAYDVLDLGLYKVPMFQYVTGELDYTKTFERFTFSITQNLFDVNSINISKLHLHDNDNLFKILVTNSSNAVINSLFSDVFNSHDYITNNTLNLYRMHANSNYNFIISADNGMCCENSFQALFNDDNYTAPYTLNIERRFLAQASYQFIVSDIDQLVTGLDAYTVFNNYVADNTIPSKKIQMDSLGGSLTLQNMNDQVHSSGILAQCQFTNTNSILHVSACSILIKKDNTLSGTLFYYEYPGGDIAIPNDNTYYYVYLAFTGGNNIELIISTQSQDDFQDHYTKVLLGTAFNYLNIDLETNQNNNQLISDHACKMVDSMKATMGISIDMMNEPVITFSGQQFACSSFIMWLGLTKLIKSAKPLAQTYSQQFYNGSIWGEVYSSAINNSQYQGASGLITMTNNRYSNTWIYAAFGNVNEWYSLQDNNEFTSVSLAGQSSEPNNKPSHFANYYCKLIGKFTFQKSGNILSFISYSMHASPSSSISLPLNISNLSATQSKSFLMNDGTNTNVVQQSFANFIYNGANKQYLYNSDFQINTLSLDKLYASQGYTLLYTNNSINVSQLNSTHDGTTYLRNDFTWQAIAAPSSTLQTGLSLQSFVNQQFSVGLYTQPTVSYNYQTQTITIGQCYIFIRKLGTGYDNSDIYYMQTPAFNNVDLSALLSDVQYYFYFDWFIANNQLQLLFGSKSAGALQILNPIELQKNLRVFICTFAKDNGSSITHICQNTSYNYYHGDILRQVKNATECIEIYTYPTFAISNLQFSITGLQLMVNGNVVVCPDIAFADFKVLISWNYYNWSYSNVQNIDNTNIIDINYSSGNTVAMTSLYYACYQIYYVVQNTIGGNVKLNYMMLQCDREVVATQYDVLFEYLNTRKPEFMEVGFNCCLIGRIIFQKSASSISFIRCPKVSQKIYIENSQQKSLQATNKVHGVCVYNSTFDATLQTQDINPYLVNGSSVYGIDPLKLKNIPYDSNKFLCGDGTWKGIGYVPSYSLVSFYYPFLSAEQFAINQAQFPLSGNGQIYLTKAVNPAIYDPYQGLNITTALAFANTIANANTTNPVNLPMYIYNTGLDISKNYDIFISFMMDVDISPTNNYNYFGLKISQTQGTGIQVETNSICGFLMNYNAGSAKVWFKGIAFNTVSSAACLTTVFAQQWFTIRISLRTNNPSITAWTSVHTGYNEQDFTQNRKTQANSLAGTFIQNATPAYINFYSARGDIAASTTLYTHKISGFYIILKENYVLTANSQHVNTLHTLPLIDQSFYPLYGSYFTSQNSLGVAALESTGGAVTISGTAYSNGVTYSLYSANLSVLAYSTFQIPMNRSSLSIINVYVSFTTSQVAFINCTTFGLTTQIGALAYNNPVSRCIFGTLKSYYASNVSHLLKSKFTKTSVVENQVISSFGTHYNNQWLTISIVNDATDLNNILTSIYCSQGFNNTSTYFLSYASQAVFLQTDVCYFILGSNRNAATEKLRNQYFQSYVY